MCDVDVQARVLGVGIGIHHCDSSILDMVNEAIVNRANERIPLVVVVVNVTEPLHDQLIGITVAAILLGKEVKASKVGNVCVGRLVWWWTLGRALEAALDI